MDISRWPVSLAEFGGFIRTGEYFQQAHWDLAAGPVEGGDAVLRRIGYGRLPPDEPVTHITWYEADAYCRSQGGRLPSLQEWAGLRVDSTVFRQRRYPSTLLASRVLPGEWCWPWFNRHSDAPHAKPGETPATRVVAGHGEWRHAAPSFHDAQLGFRLVRPVTLD